MSSELTIPAELRKKYIDRRTKDEVMLTEALAAGNFEPFKVLGHQLKGNALSYGYPELGELGVKMESAGDEKNSASAQFCVEELKRWIKKVNSVA